MKKILIVLLAFIALHATGQNPYIFTFDKNDFSVKTTDGICYIDATNWTGTSTSKPDGPALPVMTKKILNHKDNAIESFTIDVKKELVAENVVFYANGYPVATDTPLDSFPERTFASDSELDCVTLLTNNAIQNGYSFSVLSVKPYLYDADSKKLYFVNKVTLNPIISITSAAESSVQQEGVSVPIVRPDLICLDEFLNADAADSYAGYGGSYSRSQTESEEYDYLIITSNDLISSFDEFIRWKNQKGVKTRIVSVETIEKSESNYVQLVDRIKEYIFGCYQNNGIKYVLLGGDTPIIPVKKCKVTINIINSPQPKTDEIPTDLFFACFDKNFIWDANQNGIFGERSDNVDIYPEIMVGRLPARNQSDVHAFINKLLKYERSLPKTGFSDRLLFGGMYLSNYFNGLSDAYVIGKNIVDHDVLPFWNGTVDMLYDTNPNSSETFDPNNLSNYINTSYNIIDIATHGSYDAYLAQFSPYLSSHAEKQNNTYPSIIITSACNTNEFDSECLSEAFIRNPSGGAIAYIGSTRAGLGRNINIDNPTYPDLMHLSHLNECSFFKSLLNESAPDYSNNLGFVYNKSKNLIYDKSIDHNSYLYLAYGINLIGDAEMPVSTRNNKNISASFSYDKYLRERIVRITDKQENCIITLSDQRVNPEILFISKDSDYVRFAEPEGPFVITITGRNCTPRVYEPTEYEVLHLHDCVIDADRHYIAGDVIIGNNVTVKAGVTLTLNSKGGFRILDNVVCEGNAKLILKNI